MRKDNVTIKIAAQVVEKEFSPFTFFLLHLSKAQHPPIDQNFPAPTRYNTVA
jgi:hypothetical protein